MEHVGFDQNVIHSTIHCTKYNNSNTSIETATKRVSDVSGKYHTYGMEWTSEYMRFYIDGASFFTYRNDGTGKDAWPFDSYFYPILNIAYGGDWGGQQGIDDSALPATMDVDYIRVFQK
jgi:beta-glucanase (GH16 family)